MHNVTRYLKSIVDGCKLMIFSVIFHKMYGYKAGLPFCAYLSDLCLLLNATSYQISLLLFLRSVLILSCLLSLF